MAESGRSSKEGSMTESERREVGVQPPLDTPVERRDLSGPPMPRSIKRSEDTTTEDDSRQAAELDTNLSIIGLCGIALTTGESWIALGNSLTLAIYNGGSAGVLYGFVATSVCYWLVAASIAELASAMPSTATVYCWAKTTGGPRYGKICSWLAGYWLWAAWILGSASLVSFLSLQAISIYEVLHPDHESQSWQIFCSYIACNWVICLLVLLADDVVKFVSQFGVWFTILGWLISIIICAVGPYSMGHSYASSASVWTSWRNETGWRNDGFVFCLGMLNAALATCAPDITGHMAEEIPRPKRNVPYAILAQYIASFVTGLSYLITLFYASPSLPDITGTRSVFPLSQIYLRATNPSTTVGLLVVAMVPTFMGATGAYQIAGRQNWALAREGVLPFSNFFIQVNVRTNSPSYTVLLVGLLTSALGCIYLGSTRAFNDITGSFVVFTSLAYLATLIPHLFSLRRNVRPGVFWMPEKIGLIVCAAACIFLAAFSVIFCFPVLRPVTGSSMNYTSAIVGFWTLLVLIYWFARQRS